MDGSVRKTLMSGPLVISNTVTTVAVRQQAEDEQETKSNRKVLDEEGYIEVTKRHQTAT